MVEWSKDLYTNPHVVKPNITHNNSENELQNLVESTQRWGELSLRHGSDNFLTSLFEIRLDFKLPSPGPLLFA